MLNIRAILKCANKYFLIDCFQDFKGFIKFNRFFPVFFAILN